MKNPIDDSTKQDVNQQFIDYSKEVNDKRNQMHDEKENKKVTHDQVMRDYKRAGKLSNMFGIDDKASERKQ